MTLICIAVGIVGAIAIVTFIGLRKPTPAPAGGAVVSHYDFRRSLFAIERVPANAIVMVGDSLVETVAWSQLTGCAKVINRGIGADTTAGVLARIDDIVALAPRAVVLLIGINDISARIPHDTTIENFRKILSRLAGIEVIGIYLLPMRSDRPTDPANAAIDALNADLQKLFAEFRSHAIDLRPQLGSPLDPQLSVDRIHLNAAGYARFRDQLLPAVDRICS